MKIVAVVAAVLLCFLPQVTSAQDQAVYVAVHGGPSWFETEIDDVGPIDLKSEGESGLYLGGAIGYDGGFWRVEGYGAYDNLNDGQIGVRQISGLDLGVNVKSISAGVNAYLEHEIPGARGLEAYAGGGAGYSWIETEVDAAGIDLINDTDDAMSYQLMAGVRMPVTETVELGLGYRYWTIPEYDVDVTGLGNDADGEISSHSVDLSLAYRFSL